MIIRSQEKHYGRQRESLTYNTEPVVLPQRKARETLISQPHETPTEPVSRDQALAAPSARPRVRV